MIGNDVTGRIEPEACRGGEHLPLERYRGQHLVEGALPIRRDQDAAAPVGQVIIVAHLPRDITGDLGKMGIDEDVAHAGSNNLPQFRTDTEILGDGGNTDD